MKSRICLLSLFAALSSIPSASAEPIIPENFYSWNFTACLPTTLEFGSLEVSYGYRSKGLRESYGVYAEGGASAVLAGMLKLEYISDRMFSLEGSGFLPSVTLVAGATALPEWKLAPTFMARLGLGYFFHLSRHSWIIPGLQYSSTAVRQMSDWKTKANLSLSLSLVFGTAPREDLSDPHVL